MADDKATDAAANAEAERAQQQQKWRASINSRLQPLLTRRNAEGLTPRSAKAAAAEKAKERAKVRSPCIS